MIDDKRIVSEKSLSKGVIECKVIHKGWTEWESVKKDKKASELLKDMKPIFGKFQYVYSSKKGEVSLIELTNYWMDGKTIWEIYSLSGNLFDDVERFKTFEEARDKVVEILREDA